MRFLFVGTNRGGGGTESHFISMTGALAEAGHDVSAAIRADDVIHRGIAGDSRIRLFAADFRSRRDLRAIQEVASIAREVKADWIVGSFKAEYWGLAVAARLARVPLVLFSHLDQRIRPLMLHRYCRLVRGVVVPSQYLRQRKIERGIPASKLAVLGNPMDVDHFRADPALRATMRASLGLAPDDVLLGYAGRFEGAKGVEILARAAARASSANGRLHILWVGHGPLEGVLREMAARHGLAHRQHWMPWVPDVLPAYAAMDMLALPSIGSETFGRVLVEAQSCGVPVLGARNGGIPEALLDGETGILLPPGDVEAWAAGIETLAGDQARRSRLGNAARGFALQFDGRRIAHDFIRVLDWFGSRVPLAPEVRPPVRLAREVAGD